MSKIVIVFHSGYGHTAKVAAAVAEGSGGTLLAIDAEGNLPEGGWEQLDAASTIVFGSPTYMGRPELAVQEVRRRVQQGLVHAEVERQARRWFHQQRVHERRQAVHAALPVHA